MENSIPLGKRVRWKGCTCLLRLGLSLAIKMASSVLSFYFSRYTFLTVGNVDHLQSAVFTIAYGKLQMQTIRIVLEYNTLILITYLYVIGTVI